MRFKVLPAVAVLLAASSGVFAPTPVPEPGPGYENQHHQPWSEPVRFKQDPKATIALIASSGPREASYTARIEPGAYIPWFAPLSEPVRVKPALKIGLFPFDFAVHGPIVPNRFVPMVPPLSEPVMVKARLTTGDQPYFSFVEAAPFPEPPSVDKWLYPFAEPVRIRPFGMLADQQAAAYFIKVEPLPLVGLRKPLYTQAMNGYPSNYWRGQTNG